MKKISLISIFLTVALCLGVAVNAQLDSRQRNVQTIISDGLAQLPAKTADTYNEVIGEMAATGQPGIEMLASMLKPASEAQNSLFEYAIDAIVSHVTKADNESLQKQVHDGLAAALKKCADKPNQAFLMTQLSRLTRQGDVNLYASYLNDEYLHDYAINGLSLVPGGDNAIADLINSASKPDAKLAYVAYFKHLENVEPTLIKWTQSSDVKVLEAVYNALAEIGGSASLKPLQVAAKAHGYANDPTGATDAYLRLLNRLGGKDALQAAKALLNSKNDYVRCAALAVVLNNDKQNALNNIFSALKDKDRRFRDVALINAQSVAGDGVFDKVAAKFKSFSPETQEDIVSWLGNNKVASQIGILTGLFGADNEVLASLAMEAASKIGGDQALEALVNALGNSKNNAKAAEVLMSFNGDINSGVIKALASDNPQTVVSALNLASERRIQNAYPYAIAILKGNSGAARDAALNALAGVVNPDNFSDICNLLEAADENEIIPLQLAAANSIAALSPDVQYIKIDARMKSLMNRGKVALYYPLLAQTGTDDAIQSLLSDFNASKSQQAYNALLSVNSPSMIPVLFEIAANNPNLKDSALNRYIDLIQSNVLPAIDQYTLLGKGLGLNPSVKIQNRLLSALAAGRTLPAAMLAAKYLDNKDNSFEAATTVKYILAKEPSLQQGETAKGILEKAHKVFMSHKAHNADAGYAADEIAGILNGFNNDGGFAQVGNEGPAGEFENFEMYFDWNGKDPVNLNLRSMPYVSIDPQTGISVGGGERNPLAAGPQTVFVKMLNDRAFVEVGSTPFATSEIIAPAANQSVANYSGKVAVDNPDAVNNFYFNALPDTPVFVLSDEEKAQGFEVLFDGRSLEKWHGNTAAYVPQDGSIYVTAKYGGTGNLYTKKNYSDFIFRFEFFFDVPGVNNGIGIRTGKDVTGVDAAFDGMEIQVLDHDDPMYGGYPFGWTGIQPYQIHGSIYGVVGAKHLDFGPIKQWHTEEIKAVGDHITVTVDGQVIVDADIREACQGHAVSPDGGNRNDFMVDHRNHPGLFNKEGYISFCGHGQGVKFRNVRVLDLSKNNKNKTKKTKK